MQVYVRLGIRLLYKVGVEIRCSIFFSSYFGLRVHPVEWKELEVRKHHRRTGNYITYTPFCL